MTLTRNMLSGEVDSGSGCVVFAFAFGCCCHALSNLSKGISAVQDVKEVLTKTLKVAQLFRNIHVSIYLLSCARIGMEQPPPTVNYYSRTR